MTAVLGMRDERGVVWLAADRSITYPGGSAELLAHSKMITADIGQGQATLAFAGSALCFQVLRWLWWPKHKPEGVSLELWWMRDVRPHLRALLEEHGALQDGTPSQGDSAERVADMSALMSADGHLWKITDALSIERIHQRCDGLGSCWPGLGVLHHLYLKTGDPSAKIQHALEVCRELHPAQVAGPIDVVRHELGVDNEVRRG